MQRCQPFLAQSQAPFFWGFTFTSMSSWQTSWRPSSWSSSLRNPFQQAPSQKVQVPSTWDQDSEYEEISVEMEGASEAETAVPDERNTQEKKTKPKVQKRKAQPVRRPKVNQKPKTKQYTMCQHCQCPTPVGRMFHNVKDIRERAARLKLKSMALRAKPPPAAGAQAQIPTFKDNTARSCAKRLALVGRLVCRNGAFELVDSEVESASDEEEMSENLHSPTELVSESE